MKPCIFLISARGNLIEQCLKLLDTNYNRRYNYPTLIFYHGDRYEDPKIRTAISSINDNTEYRFHKIEAKIPDHISEKDLFWNLNNNYARNFGRKRIGYLHANYFWNNFMYYPELSEFDYMMRIDDDSWFKGNIDFDFFEEINKRKGFFGTGFSWNNFSPSHLQTRHGLFNWIRDYVNRYNVNVKNKQLAESLKGEVDNELFHTLKWNCGNCNIYNRKMFENAEWSQYSKAFNKLAGGYRYRWGDCEVIGLFAYMYLDNPLIDFQIRSSGIYEPQLPNTGVVTC